MNTVTVTLSTLVDRALEELQGPSELGKKVVRSAALTASETTFTLSDTTPSVSDLLEFGDELMLITGKSTDTNPTFTVSRGYYQTTAVAHDAEEVGYVNPQWNRHRVAGAVRRAFARLEGLGVPLLKSTAGGPEESVDSDLRMVLSIPSEARDVWNVRQDLIEVEHWEFIEDLPTSDYPTSKVVRLPKWVQDDDWFNVVYRAPYRWDSFPDEPTGTSEIELPEGAEDLPAAYAAAWLTSAREISRTELDRATEWNASEPSRGGVSQSLVRAKWQEFYRALDEVRRLDTPLPRRPYVRRRRGWM